jgi:2'-5' RNA ligase
MNYFIGITPPAHTNEKISSFQKRFPSNKLPYIFEPHITVKTKNGLQDDLAWLSKVTHIIEQHPSFTVGFNGIDMFGDSVVILKPKAPQELIMLHKKLYDAIAPDESDTSKKYFENKKFLPHFTLGMSSWGMSKDELTTMKELSIHELHSLPDFTVTFLRIYRQTGLDEPYLKLLDITLNEIH